MDIAALDSRIDIAEVGTTRYLVAVVGDPLPDEIRDAVFPLASHHGASVVVDLGGMPVVGSPVADVLTEGAALVRSGGGEFVVVTRDPRARWLFDTSGLARVARIERTLDAAVQDVFAA